MKTTQDSELEYFDLLETISDPEIPVLTIVDLGIVRSCQTISEGKVKVVITPTYTGCPAMDTIADDIKKAFAKEGLEVVLETQIQPAWTTDWITEKGKANLEAYGIAPPAHKTSDKGALMGRDEVRCPQCKSTNTEVISQFGSTACKALYRCNDCLEPFDYFKCL